MKDVGNKYNQWNILIIKRRKGVIMKQETNLTAECVIQSILKLLAHQTGREVTNLTITYEKDDKEKPQQFLL